MLHIVTPLSRPDNIKKIADSFRSQIKGYKSVFWHIILDGVLTEEEKSYVASQLMFDDYAKLYDSPHIKALAGHAHRNFFLDAFETQPLGLRSENDWIYFLDDDTILHPEFITTMTDTTYSVSVPIQEKGMIIFNQDLNEHTPRLKADRNNIIVGQIDTGMFLFRYNSCPHLRFDVSDYCADGHFAMGLRDHFGQDKIYCLNRTLSYYNYLRP